MDALSAPLLLPLGSSGRLLCESFYRAKLSSFRQYEPEKWAHTLTLHASRFVLQPCLLIVLYTVLLIKLAIEWTPWLMPFFTLNPLAHTVLGSALSFLMVFRTNTVYLASRYPSPR